MIYFKQNKFSLLMLLLLVVSLSFFNIDTLHQSFAKQVKHTDLIEPSLVQRRMSQYKQILNSKTCMHNSLHRLKKVMN